MNKFEQLIEYVINDEEAKARELFHDIVVEKSRQIYEEMMQEEEDDIGGSAAADLIADVEVEEQGLGEEDMDMDMKVNAEDDADEDDADEEDHHADVGGEEDLEDRVLDLEDKLDELMAEFEELMADQGGAVDDAMDMDMDTDDMDMDAEEVVDDELETEGVMEAVNLKAAPAPVKSEEAGINKKSTVAANSGAKGAVAKPVHVTGETAQGRPAPTAKDAIGKVGNTPAQSTQEPKPAVKPTLSQASGVNTKSVLKQV